jgi:hypothetical protein
MTGNSNSSKRVLLAIGSLVFCAGLMAAPMPRSQDPQAPPDNTKQNKDQSNPTADDQKMNPESRDHAEDSQGAAR